MNVTNLCYERMSANDWGPHFWRILHVLGQKHRLATHNTLVYSLLENLCNVLPCAACQRHCRDYWIAKRLRGPAPPSPVHQTVRGRRMIVSAGSDKPSSASWEPVALQEWLWTFHNAVTSRVSEGFVDGVVGGGGVVVGGGRIEGTSDPSFPRESLSVYETMSVKDDIEFIYAYIAKYANQHGLKPQPFLLFRAQLNRLRAIYSF